jgi:hypothetical protein
MPTHCGCKQRLGLLGIGVSYQLSQLAVRALLVEDDERCLGRASIMCTNSMFGSKQKTSVFLVFLALNSLQTDRFQTRVLALHLANRCSSHCSDFVIEESERSQS